jgi:hypothetical protein
MTASSHYERSGFGNASRESGKRCYEAITNEHKGAPNLELFNVFRKIPRGHSFVNLLVSGKFAKLLDSRFHVVTRKSLALGDAVEVDLIDDARVVGNDSLFDG